MEILKTESEDVTLLALTGRLDTARAPLVHKALAEAGNSPADVVLLDFAGVEYVSSAGLRVLLMGEKAFKAAGKTMKLKSVQPEVMEVFNITGFTGILSIE